MCNTHGGAPEKKRCFSAARRRRNMRNWNQIEDEIEDEDE